MLSMSYCIIIRGPLGIGKTTIAKKLAKSLRAKYVSIDDLLEKNGLDVIDKDQGCIPAKNFIKAAETFIAEIKPLLKKGIPIIFDGNFYYRKQISHLKRRLDCRFFVFTLEAPLSVCIARDGKREKPYGKEATEVVHDLTKKFSYGIRINTSNKTAEKVKKEIISYLKSQK